MRMTTLAFALSLLPFVAHSDSQCGPFHLGTSKEDDGWARINGTKPESQKFTFLKAQGDYDNVKMQWMVPTNSPGKWYGMDYVKKDGKAILNVQLVQANMNAPRVYGTYDCVKVD
ncbi:hypothetical protein HHA33_17800 [Phytobacter diazotrophicus]|uniref:hypothetical protein n=1 Tax=Phytobacter diazotrophicus TaxID=395631 RepID=UPI0014517DE1|nr:hypothetical protein [Phytobacter diazotrophicus]QJF18282.1 hypothetical protein HHA33_17800 [Phytobacter diazotrophicus]